MALRDLRDEIVIALDGARTTVPGPLIRQRVLDKITGYYDALIAQDATFAEILQQEKERALLAFDNTKFHYVDEDKEVARRNRLDEVVNIIQGSLGWVEAKPVDLSAIATRKLRDRGDPNDTISLSETVIVEVK